MIDERAVASDGFAIVVPGREIARASGFIKSVENGIAEPGSGRRDR